LFVVILYLHPIYKGATGFIYGKPKPINVYYNAKSYKVVFDVLNLALKRSVSIGTDLMPRLGIAYTGLAVPRTPPTKHEEESPFQRYSDSKPRSLWVPRRANELFSFHAT
jgi:hypothetical protein